MGEQRVRRSGSALTTPVVIVALVASGAWLAPAAVAAPVSVGTTPRNPGLADLNGDGHLDLAVASGGSRERS